MAGNNRYFCILIEIPGLDDREPVNQRHVLNEYSGIHTGVITAAITISRGDEPEPLVRTDNLTPILRYNERRPIQNSVKPHRNRGV